MKTYRLVVFDWEGTLNDPLGHLLTWADTTLASYQLPPVEWSLKRQWVSVGLEYFIKKLFSSLTFHDQKMLFTEAQTCLAQSAQPVLFPEVEWLLTALLAQGKQLAIATNKGMTSLQRALQMTKLSSFFAITRSAGQTAPKPCPQMLEEIMSISNHAADETLMVGDMLVDIEMAKALGVDAIGMDFYHQHHTALLEAGALYVYDDMMKLAKFLDVMP